MKGFQKKYLLKKSQSERLPDFVTKRRKQGFNAPVSHWLTTSLSEQYRNITIREGEVFFNPEYVKNLWDEHGQKEKDNSFKLLTLIKFLIWFKQYDACL